MSILSDIHEHLVAAESQISAMRRCLADGPVAYHYDNGKHTTVRVIPEPYLETLGYKVKPLYFIPAPAPKP